MKKTWFAVFIALSCYIAQAQQISPHFSNLKQLTNGGSNGESYWAPDSKRIIFQSTRDGANCDQQYIMNADGSDQHMVSTGKGVTTCGYFLSDNKHFVYASTHEGNPSCPAPPDRSKGYVWGVHPTFDIYMATLDGKIVKKLTDTPGYDAEATVNFKTKKITYTSMASGDLELWSMNEDGSGKKQITHTEGYDGGSVYSRDGKMMVWRAFHPDTQEKKATYQSLLKENLTAPMKMELFIAKADGSDAKQITNFDCASFAPTFTPDGKKILFATNKDKCDSGNFDLYLINLDGTGLERVTEWGKFTSFPEFSPDGKKLIFSSNYQGKSNYEFNIFSVDWKP
jgi:TolB protein